MDPRRHRWAFSFMWINVAVAVVVLVQLVAGQVRSARQLLDLAGYSLVYANLTGLLAVLVVGAVSERLARHRPPPVPVVAIAVLVLCAAGCLLAQTSLMVIGLVVPRHFWPDYLHTLRVAIPLAAVFGLGAVVHASLNERAHSAEEKLREKEMAEERAHKLATEARLRSLEARIHPHFLFNTLNSISALIAVDPARAEQLVGRLAVLLRASLDNSIQSLIPLEQELAMVESYIAIERARFGGKLRGSVKVPAELRAAKVPPMSVQALVENAVKHGLSPQGGGGEVSVTASADSAGLHIEVRDTGPGFDMTAVRSGHGLDNLVERLDALFGARASVNASLRDGHCVVEMVVPAS